MLSWPAQSQAMRDVDPRATAAMIQRLRAFFKWQVMDLGGLPSEDLVQSAAQEADQVWAVCDQSVGGVVSLTELLKTMPTKANGKPMCDGLVVNRVIPGAGMAPEEIAKRLNIPLLQSLPPREAAMLEAFARGVLLSEADASDAYVSKVRELAKAMANGVDISAVQKKAGLSDWVAQVRERLGGVRRARSAA